MGENPSAQRPRMKRPSWGQLLSMAIAIGVLFGTGAAVANHDPLLGIVVGATIVVLMSISSALVLRGRQH
jgi:drug/metabolite transporter (DMT)-like permease